MATLSRLPVLFYRTRIYYRMYGLAATVRKIASYTIGSHGITRDVTGLWSASLTAVSSEVIIPHPPEHLHPLGPLTRRAAFVQEIEVSFEWIDQVELLLATYNRSNTSSNFIAIVSEDGEVLHEERFSSSAVVDNAFFRLHLRERIDTARCAKLLLVLGSTDGSKTNSITAWTNQTITGGLFSLPPCAGDAAQAAEASRTRQATLVRGSLVYKIRGKQTLSHTTYHQPPCPVDFEERCGKTPLEVLVWKANGAEETGIGGAAVKAMANVAGMAVTSKADEVLARIKERKADVLLFSAASLNEAVKNVLHAAHLSYVPAVYCLDERLLAAEASKPSNANGLPGDASDKQAFSRIQVLRSSTFALCATSPGKDFSTAQLKRAFVAPSPSATLPQHLQWQALFATILDAYRRLHRPLVSIVTILYRKEAEITSVLDSYFNQTYEGDVEVIFVDDCSPDRSVEVARSYIETHRAGNGSRRSPRFRFVRNERNVGNCISRNNGIREAKGDLVVIVDADCMLNRDFIKRHVEAHAFDDCDVVIGPLNIETEGREPRSVLEQYESRLDLVVSHSKLQDPLNRNGFLNCITRNFSIKSNAIDGELFDPLFTYSADPESGFGWEDVEMGYRLYRRGARIKFVEEAFAIHVSPEVEDTDPKKPLRSIKNFRRLLEKHPELSQIARRWVNETGKKILEWADATGAGTNADRRYLEQLLEPVRATAFIPRPRPLRILTYRWHVPHQYELYKLPFDFTLVTGLGCPMTEAWEFGQRPIPHNARFRQVSEIDPQKYDLAILHFDENVLAPENTNGQLGPEWGRAFRWFRENVRIPSIAVCHGTPQFYGQYNINYKQPDLMQVIEAERKRLVDYLADIPVVVNSHQAQREWGYRQSIVIWHGFDPTEFPPATYERGILSPLGPLVTSRPHYRGYFLYNAVFDRFPAAFAPDTLHVPDPHIAYTGNAYAIAKYRNYVDRIRSYSVYFNPTLRSPMPRARAEPMMCGVVTVNANNHDVELFVKNGVNGFYSNEPAELRDYLLYLMRHPDETRKIGRAGRETAIDIFNHDRYLGDWLRLIGKQLDTGFAARRLN